MRFSGPSTKSPLAIVALVYLTSTIRSQGSSPSQRLDPASGSWVCFTPHSAHGLFLASRASPAQPAVTPLGVRCSRAVGLTRTSPGYTLFRRHMPEDTPHRHGAGLDFGALLRPSVRHPVVGCSPSSRPLLS